MSNKRKREDQLIPADNLSVKQVCKCFSFSLISQSIDNKWESQEIARLMILCISLLNYNKKKIVKYIINCGIRDPNILSSLIDEGIDITTADIVYIIHKWSNDIDNFVDLLKICLDQDIVNVTDSEVIALLHQIEYEMSDQQQKRYITLLCSYSKKKKYCGRILNKFTESMLKSSACSLIYDVISHDFYLDLDGSTKDLLKQLPNLKEDLLVIFKENFNMNDNDEIVDSDDDGQGNLKGFIAYSDEEESVSDLVDTDNSINEEDASDSSDIWEDIE